MKIVSTILNYLSYASTWNAIVALATAAGLTLAPDKVEAIISAAIAAVGAIQLFIKDSDMELKAKAADEAKNGL